MYSQGLLVLLGLSTLSSAAAIERRAAVSNPPPAGWTYKGCYTDNVQYRALGGASYSNATSMTEETCISFCASSGYDFAGLEYAGEFVLNRFAKLHLTNIQTNAIVIIR
jgi:hypothetical protein